MNSSREFDYARPSEEDDLLPRIFPSSHSARKKPRRWPLVLRVWKGSIHLDVLPAVLGHAAVTALVVYLDRHVDAHLALPSTIVPSLSIVVGLMLVFRNQASFDRFWSGRNHLTTIVAVVRNLTRVFLVNSAQYENEDTEDRHGDDAERRDTETTIRILIAILYAVKHYLRAEWRSPDTPTPMPKSGPYPAASGAFSAPNSRPQTRQHSRNPSGGIIRPGLFRNESGLSIFQGSGMPQSLRGNGDPTRRREYNEDPPGSPTLNRSKTDSSVTTRIDGEDLHRSALLNMSHTDSGFGSVSPGASTVLNSASRLAPLQRHNRYEDLLPSDLGDYEGQGLSLPIQLSVLVEAYVCRQVKRGRLSPPQQATQIGNLMGTMLDAFGRLETIRTTPLPVAHLIHTTQVLTLYLLVLPFTLVSEMSWWAVPIVALVAFTLYGIDAIGRQLEDPFGYDKNDIKVDDIVEDARVEGMVLLGEWRRGGQMFNLDRL